MCVRERERERERERVREREWCREKRSDSTRPLRYARRMRLGRYR